MTMTILNLVKKTKLQLPRGPSTPELETSTQPFRMADPWDVLEPWQPGFVHPVRQVAGAPSAADQGQSGLVSPRDAAAQEPVHEAGTVIRTESRWKSLSRVRRQTGWCSTET